MKHSSLLSNIWCSELDGTPAVIHRNNRITSRRQLFKAAETLSEQIAGKRVCIFCTSSALEAVAILAAIKGNAPSVYPATNQEGALREIADSFDILLTDETSPPDINHIRLSDDILQNDGEVSPQAEPVPQNYTMTFYTSGSTGKPKEVKKYIYQKDREIAYWEQSHGANVAGAEVHATASHQHIYGLMFRLLWPLCSGRPFHADTAKNWDEIDEITSAERPFILVTSPTHLCRLSPLETGNLNINPKLMLSAGGFLPPENAAKATKLLNAPILEIYGSTETGAIANRFNSGENENWSKLDGVGLRLDEQGCLIVNTLLLPDGEGDFKTGDIAKLHTEDEFTLLGRADRIVKVEGKRVSLPRLEGILSEHPWIEDVHVQLLSSGKRSLAAVATISTEGQDFLYRNGRFRTGRVFEDHLKQFEDAVSVPKRWRFVGRIPRNQQSKIMPSDIEKIFEANESAMPAPRSKFTNTRFEEISQQVSENEIEIVLNLPADLDYFQGHFTDTPILPGVVQIHWAAEQIAKHFAIKGNPTKIDKLKFKKLIFPETEVQFLLTRKSETKFSFHFQSRRSDGSSEEHSSGLLSYPEAS
ncbi:AMP-binding protein [Sneathiella sp. P13V-1]|uniref:AMP-binding protein n=1 Tax=Sneathiella sp. P13V-1 TaxID=2697366 RepID=UPI00187B6775|nr:AMP-binding protein [Sneathiella sp. P13V-1]MBE7636519.1 AMP-binding protein [Sneathiella sp. P13V-1]